MHQDIFKNSPPGAAWPHKASEPSGPLLVYFKWRNEKDDAFWLGKLNETLDTLQKFALEAGLTTKKAAYYNNLCLETMPARKIYRGNMDWLKDVKAEYDPTDVMGLAGAHRIPVRYYADDLSDSEEE